MVKGKGAVTLSELEYLKMKVELLELKLEVEKLRSKPAFTWTTCGSNITTNPAVTYTTPSTVYLNKEKSNV